MFREFGLPAHATTTLEVRWIRRGPVPDPMIAWLGPFADQIEQRDDRYFESTAYDLVVKIRGGVQLDVKTFRGSLEMLTVSGTGRGYLELWEKWSFPLQASVVPPPGTPGWITLHKSRLRRSFHVADCGIEERSVDQAHQPGCSVELTEVAIGDGLWWTLGLEATGGRETLERNLHATVVGLFRDPPPDPVSLNLRYSMSYASWLFRSGSLGSRRRIGMDKSSASKQVK